MSDQMDRLKAYKDEGSEKFAALSAADNAVRNFAHARRENLADHYNVERVQEAVVSTVGQSVGQSAEVYKMFAHSEKK